jgi:hypothetical protein
MSKTPFELRYEILNLARDHLMRRYELKHSAIENRIATATLSPARAQQFIDENSIPYPSPEEIIALADQMNDFICRAK